MNETLINQLVEAMSDVQENLRKQRDMGETYSNLETDLQVIKKGIKELGDIDSLVERGKTIINEGIGKLR